MIIEDIENNDWCIKNTDNQYNANKKSISSYYLIPNSWYKYVEDLTFETKFYDTIPNILPYDKCMVRWENKSPKDSEYWGPVSTKEESERLFYTSLRCKTNPGKLYCFRPWIKIYDEFRCFWNKTLVAVSGTDECHLNNDMVTKIMIYINSIKHRIPYFRCVLDIGMIIESGELIFKIIEFNSWETNSGANFFNWNDDTEIMYGDLPDIYFKSSNFTCIRPKLEIITRIFYFNINFDNSTEFKLSPLSNQVINRFIYIHNDIWVGKFDFKLNPISWKRGNYRFESVYTENNKIYANGKIMDEDFRILGSYYPLMNQFMGTNRYGIEIIINREHIFLHLNEECKLVVRR
jgi:hypothetical protein